MTDEMKIPEINEFVLVTELMEFMGSLTGECSKTDKRSSQEMGRATSFLLVGSRRRE